MQPGDAAAAQRAAQDDAAPEPALVVSCSAATGDGSGSVCGAACHEPAGQQRTAHRRQCTSWRWVHRMAPYFGVQSVRVKTAMSRIQLHRFLEANPHELGAREFAGVTRWILCCGRARVLSGDRSCYAIIKADAGYCECTGGWTTHRCCVSCCTTLCRTACTCRVVLRGCCTEASPTKAPRHAYDCAAKAR